MASSSSEKQKSVHIVVLGAGVIGLSTVTALLCSKDAMVANLKITVVAKEFSPNTTSDIAGGLWLPYKATHVDLNRWCRETLDWLLYLNEKGALPFHESISANVPSAGPNPYRVNLVEMTSYEATSAVAEDRASWECALREAPRKVPIGETARLPPGAVEIWKLRDLPLVTTTAYLQRMQKELSATGKVQFVHDSDVQSLEKLAKRYGADVVLNCAGLGSRELLKDAQVRPVRGCLVTVDLPEDVKQNLNGKIFVFDDNPAGGLTYILPREDGCKIGGTYLPDEWDTTVSEQEQEVILQRAFSVLPELAKGKIRNRKAGLRPGRPGIRLEQDLSFNAPKTGSYLAKPMLFHNYGHGGSGWTVHWGCALSAAKLILDALSSASSTPNAKL